MEKAKMHKNRMALHKQEVINDIQAELIRKGAAEVSLLKSLVFQELDDQFSVVVENVNMNGITMSDSFANFEEEQVSFEELDTMMLISILEELENDAVEIIEELSEN